MNEFQNIRTAIIEKKSHLAIFILSVILATPAILMLVFFIIYLSGVPMNFNGVPSVPGEVLYDSFMYSFLGITAFINLVLLICIFVVSRSKAFTTIYLGETLDLEKIIYVVSPKEEIYISSSKMIQYRTKMGTVTVETNKNLLQSAREKYIFWLNLDQKANLKITEKGKNIHCRFSEQIVRSMVVKTYRIHKDDSNRISHYHEMISTRTYGNHNVQGFATYHVKSMNHSSQLPISSKIQSELNKTI